MKIILNNLFFSVLILFQLVVNADNEVKQAAQMQLPKIAEVKKISDKKYFCTVADAQYFRWLLNLIGSIHKSNYDNLEEIAVYDIGFTDDQRVFLRTIEKVTVNSVELTNKDLLKQFKTNDQGKLVRGWYAWKPVTIKQALDKFPYVLYLDAGCVVLKPLGDLFRYIQEHGYFLMQDQVWCIGGKDIQFKIGEHCTKYVLEKFKLNTSENSWILHAPNVYAAIQGLSKEKMYESYVLPTYECTKDLRNFQDDGSGPYGFGWARHDQTVYGIFARMLKLDVIEPHKDVELSACGKKFKVRVSDYEPEGPHIFYNCKGQKDFVGSIRFKSINL